MVPLAEEFQMGCILQRDMDILVTRTKPKEVISVENVIPSQSRYKALSFRKNILYCRHSLLSSVQMIQKQIWVLLVIIYSCPTNIPCEYISDYRWFMNYSTIFDYMLLSRFWLTFTKQTAVVAKTLLPLLPHPSCLLLTLCQKFLLLFQIQQNLLHLSCSGHNLVSYCKTTSIAKLSSCTGL